ncbi:histidine--tRNA ligase [Schumannella luteola]|uniref:Histidyl-tRNA synthetase n=2 Tax=Schumannella luteola TaxID=472059 RepID=A0A852YC20_9MICO|nr:histidyl-tRNA synthetase [Schumannella luteola]
MASQVNPPRGMRDFLPADKARRERVLGVIRGSYRSHGFDEIETPVVEDWARLNSGLGGDNEKLSFAVLRRGVTTEELQAATSPLELADLGLRFDLTVPLARFYASHRAELPAVFRAIQIAPVWRAERPQKGRYRQFVQCDIDILGEASTLAEAELITATLSTLDALGLEGASIRINDRRLLVGMLTGFGFTPEEHDSVLITIDKLDKVGQDGVIAELTSKGVTPSAVEALQGYFRTPRTMEFLPFGEKAIRKFLPAGADDTVVAELAGIGAAVAAARAAATAARRAQTGEVDPDTARDIPAQPDIPLTFDPFLVRGMGYYTGPIFEVAHPSVSYSLGGGGRYDGMIGRFLGSDVPAAGFSLGFERLVDLVEPAADDADGGVALVHDADLDPAALVALKAAVIETHARVRLVRRTKNVANLLGALKADGFTRFAFVDAATGPDNLGLRPLD